MTKRYIIEDGVTKEVVLASEIAQSVPPSCSARLLSIDLALIRWSVRCRTWQELSAGGSQPELGPFLAGWFCRCSGIGLSLIVADHAFRDSFRIGWREADDCIAIEEQKHPDPEIDRLNRVVADQKDLIAGAVIQLRKYGIDIRECRPSRQNAKCSHGGTPLADTTGSQSDFTKD